MEVTVLKAMVMMMTSMIPAFSMKILMIPNPVPTTMKMKMEGGVRGGRVVTALASGFYGCGTDPRLEAGFEG